MRALVFKEDEKTLKFEVDTFRFEYNIYTNRLVKIDSARKKPDATPKKSNGLEGTYSPDSTYIVYAKSHNLYMLSVKIPWKSRSQRTEN